MVRIFLRRARVTDIAAATVYQIALPLFVRKLMAPVEVKLVLSALSEETRQLNDGPDQSLGKSIATDIITPKVVDDILGWTKQIKGDILNGNPC